MEEVVFRRASSILLSLDQKQAMAAGYAAVPSKA